MHDVTVNHPRCLSVADTASLIGMSRSSIYAMLSDQAANFPRPLKIGRRTRFLADEIDAWIASRPRLKVCSNAAPN